mgnify:CR=1 FL=1
MPNKIDELNATKKRILKAMFRIKKDLEELEKYEVVAKYIKQGREIIKLNESLTKIEKNIRREQILNCKHISIISNISSSSDGLNITYFYHRRCIKCGIDTCKMDGIYPEGFYNCNDSYKIDLIPEQIEKELRKGIITDIVCTDDTVKLMYNNIISKYPNTTDEQAVQYIKRIINLIKNKNRSNKEKELILANPHKYIR